MSQHKFQWNYGIYLTRRSEKKPFKFSFRIAKCVLYLLYFLRFCICKQYSNFHFLVISHVRNYKKWTYVNVLYLIYSFRFCICKQYSNFHFLVISYVRNNKKWTYVNVCKERRNSAVQMMIIYTYRNVVWENHMIHIWIWLANQKTRYNHNDIIYRY